MIATGFERVADAFERVHGDEGAAFAATLDGELVVDLSSGVPRDALFLVFSGSKGLVAACVLLLLERGALDLDVPVARYWPGFHDGVLVRHVVSHTAALPGLRRPFGAADLLDGKARAAELAAQAPLWPPGSRLAYHALTYGWLCDGLVRRVDGRSVGRFFAEELAAPLGLELWIGLPEELEPRVTELRRADDFRITRIGDGPDPLLESLYGTVMEEFPWNDPAFHRAEIPAANAIGTARSIATFYGRLERTIGEHALARGRVELARDRCVVTGRPYAFGVGFELQTELGRFGPPADAFGHTGSGGSVHGAWPGERVGFSYAMTELRPEAGDDRGNRLLAALHQALRERSSVVQKSSPVSM